MTIKTLPKTAVFYFSTLARRKKRDLIVCSPNPHLLTVGNYVDNVLWRRKCGESGQFQGALVGQKCKKSQKVSKKYQNPLVFERNASKMWEYNFTQFSCIIRFIKTASGESQNDLFGRFRVRIRKFPEFPSVPH